MNHDLLFMLRNESDFSFPLLNNNLFTSNDIDTT